MTTNADFNAGDTVPFAAAEILDNVIVTPQAGATIDIYRDGTLIVNDGACTEKAGTGIVYYNLATAQAGVHDYIVTFASGFKSAPGRIVVGAGTGALEATSQSILSDTDTYLDATISSRSTLTSAQVWDEILTAATHNIAGSAGRRLRDIASSVILTGTAQGAGANGNQIILDTDASALDGAYDPVLIHIAEGTGAGQCRLGLQYDGSTKTLTVDRTWKVNPDTSSKYVLISHPGREHVNEGLARGGTANTITLNLSASSIDNNYKDQIVFLRSGTGEDQTAVVDSYVGSTKIATIRGTWGTIPDTTTGYVMIPTKIPDTSPFALESTSQTILADTNELQQNQDNWGFTEAEFIGYMNAFYTPGSGNTPGPVNPPDNADICRIYIHCRKKDGTNFDSITSSIELPNFQLIADQAWGALPTEWTYDSGSGLAYVDVPNTAYVMIEIVELRFRAKGYAVADDQFTCRADQLSASLT